ncbi:hypothetical protein MJA45_19690 [Paenibacillus aurantius]|uniref:Uncharacterized protein n=1 Tax=Paenibacillus aurantius TaxID=2918900 RepID=A0AA96LB13_9BACL|nr:hypothetical protein [Paenibacillus aurantius]WNQ09833.1 hypothetical protein MJA45_19690 [Paenibacillus aurantius]
MPLDDVLLEKYGEFYCSLYVAKCQPWIREVPFHEWVERQMAIRSQPARFGSIAAEDVMPELGGDSPMILFETA